VATDLRLIVNSKKLVCARCTGIHDYITKLSEDCPCDTPVAFSERVAKLNARLHANGDKDVVAIPHELTTLVVMDESARKLPRTGSSPGRLAQFELVVRHA
jgi:hypothetical protein